MKTDMPIDGKTLEEKGKPSPIRKQGHTQRKVLVFLALHKDHGYSQKEIANELKLSSGEQQARQSLLRLVAMNLATRKEIPMTTQKGVVYRIFYQVTSQGVKVTKE